MNSKGPLICVGPFLFCLVYFYKSFSLTGLAIVVVGGVCLFSRSRSIRWWCVWNVVPHVEEPQ